jgi:DNA transformation protein
VDADGIRELFSEFGPVDVRRMFGGMGIFVDGLMIALVARGEIYLKADAETIPCFAAESQRPFGYATKNGERVLTSYWRVPERLYDDAEELARWARDSLGVALRANAAKSKPKKRTGKTSKK